MHTIEIKHLSLGDNFKFTEEGQWHKVTQCDAGIFIAKNSVTGKLKRVYNQYTTVHIRLTH